jgi:Protein of unknown function (DUF2608)
MSGRQLCWTSYHTRDSVPTIDLQPMRTIPLQRMSRVLVASCAALVLASFGVASALASEVRETDDFRDVSDTVERLADYYGPDRVLLVVDIDNTLLAMNRELGSDQWFEWQKYLLDNQPKSKYLVAPDFPGLLEAQGVLYNLARMHPPQRDLPAIMGRMQGLGVNTLVLTSRGPEFRAATERELHNNGYDFARSELPVHDLPGGEYIPYDLDDLEADGLTRQDAIAFKLEEPRRVSYANGIFMTAGQPKGAMVITMLTYAVPDVRAVVYVDDNIRHVAYVFAAAAGRGKNVTAFHYTREDENVKRFQYGDKEDVSGRWKKLRHTLEEVFQ